MFKELIEKYYPEMAVIRDDIHSHPELSNQEFRTSALVMEKLKSSADCRHRCCRRSER